MESELPIAPADRTILLLASRDALAPMTSPILSRLGYRIVPGDGAEALHEQEPHRRVDLLMVDERRLGEVMDVDDEAADLGGVPIVLLCGRHGATGADPRVVGAVKRPAGMHDLYRLLQQVFEDTPRSTPRIDTQLRVHCETDAAKWDGRMLSLSENGCLIRSPEQILLGQRVQLELELPREGRLRLSAEAAYQLLPDTGMVFNALDAGSRQALGRFVAASILAR